VVVAAVEVGGQRVGANVFGRSVCMSGGGCGGGSERICD